MKDIPANYANSLSRLKGQVKRLTKEPNVLKEYDKIIREQLDSAVIEEVAELERKECVCDNYLPHQAVIRRDAKTTKLRPRVVYDASSKEGKKATAKGLKKLSSNKELQGYLEGDRIEWRFNLERVPWWASFRELFGVLRGA